MTTYNIDIQGDTLKVGFGLISTGDQIVIDAASKLEKLISTQQIQGGDLLKIDGPITVAVGCVIANYLGNKFRAIAICDPKIGKVGYKTFIVVISHTPEYQIGQLIYTQELELIEKKRPKIVLCGPANSGKSCLRQGLRKAIINIKDAPYPHLVRACPDGDGSWYSEAAQRDPELAKRLRQEYKSEFTPEFAQKAAGWVKAANQPLNIIDVGGKISDENRLIMSHATHTVILSKDKTLFTQWKDFCDELKLSTIALIYSDYEGKEDQIEQEIPILTGSIHYLERGENISQRPMIKKLAQTILNLV